MKVSDISMLINKLHSFILTSKIEFFVLIAGNQAI